MDLKFRQPHLSIRAFPDITLPQLALVIGPNGSGKSHMLQAIARGSISNSIVPVNEDNPTRPNSPVRLLVGGQNAQLFPGPYSPRNLGSANQQLEGAGLSFSQARSEALVAPLQALSKLVGGIENVLAAGEDIWRLGPSEVTKRSVRPVNEQDVTAIFDQAATQLQNASDQARLGRGNSKILLWLPNVAERLNVSILNVEELQVRQFSPWGSSDQFQPNIAMVFGAYRDALIRNRLARLADDDNETRRALSEDEFLDEFGPPPWVLLNETLHIFGLPYDVVTPTIYESLPYNFLLKKRMTGDPVEFQNLSSGEKVLLQFALSTYQYDENLISVTRPQVLLLDEMDASLHPEMVNRWLGAISDGLVGQQGMNVILTTHSPTTVALAPEDSLFEMRDGLTGLTKISKQDAINRLTFGLPTLSIDFSGQRQVFTESDTDASIYQSVYSLIKASIDCPCELNFLSTGMRTKDGGEINSGCTIVTNIVQSLTDAGNRAVYGLIDWDGLNVSTDRIKVVSEGLRDGIENVLLDPLLICLLLTKIRCAPECLADIASFVGARQLAPVDLQRMVDAVQHATFPTSKGEIIEVSYLGGAKTNVICEYLTTDDHDLEVALVKAFPQLNRWAGKSRGALIKAVVNEVLTEHQVFCPSDLRLIFETIANAPR